MNKKIIVLIAVIMMVAGGATLAVGLMMGAMPYISVGASSNTRQSKGEIVTGTVLLDEFDTLNLDIASLDAYIVKGDSYKLDYRVYEVDEPQVESSGKHLTVKQPSRKAFTVMDFSFAVEKEEQYYKITVPENAGAIDVTLQASSGKIDVDSVNIKGKVHASSGEIFVKNIESEELSIGATSGDVELDNIATDKLTLNLTSGDIKADDCIVGDLYAKATSGSVKLNKMMVQNAQFNMTSGNVSFDAIGSKDDYAFDIEATSGNIIIDGVETEHKYKAGEGKDKSITADVTSGKFKVTFSD